MGGAIGSLFGGGAPSQPNVQVYQPTGTPTQDTNLQALLQQQQNTVGGAANPYTQYSPQFASIYNSIYNSPYAAGAQTAANTAGTQSTGVGTNALANSTALSGAVNPLLAGGQQVYNMGLDPQQALYNQQLQGTNDAANVANAQYGLTGQQAAGNLNQATTNFNIDWQNNELQRALSGLSGASGADTAAGALGTTAAGLGNTGATATLAGGNTPYQAAGQISTNQSSALQNYINALLGPSTSAQATIGNEQNYLNTGVSASEGGASQAAQDYQNQFGDTSSIFGGLGSILGLGTGAANSTIGGNLLSSLFGGSSSAAGAGASSDAFYDALAAAA